MADRTAALTLGLTASRRRLLVFVVLFGLFAAVPFVAQAFGEPFYVRLFTRIMILGLSAVSLDLLLGFGGLVSLGHAAFVGVGAYTVGILAYHADNGGLFLGLFPGSDQAWVVWPAAGSSVSPWKAMRRTASLNMRTSTGRT